MTALDALVLERESGSWWTSTGRAALTARKYEQARVAMLLAWRRDMEAVVEGVDGQARDHGGRFHR